MLVQTPVVYEPMTDPGQVTVSCTTIGPPVLPAPQAVDERIVSELVHTGGAGGAGGGGVRVQAGKLVAPFEHTPGTAAQVV